MIFFEVRFTMYVLPNPVRRFVLRYDLRCTIFEVCRAFRSVFRGVMGERMIVRVLRIGSDFVSRYDATKSIRFAPL